MRAVQPTNLLSTAEAVEAIGLKSPSTISRWVDAGRITPAKKLGGKTGAYLFTEDEVRRVAAEYAASQPESEGAA